MRTWWSKPPSARAWAALAPAGSIDNAIDPTSSAPRSTGVRALRAFLVNLKGAINSFRLYATIELQNANTGVTVSSTAASGASTMAITGYTTAMKAGQYMTVKGQLVCCTADQSGSTVYFQPPLRQSASAGTTVVTSRPYALVCLTDSRVGWAIGNARMHSISIDVEEAILETDATAPEGEAP